MPQLRRRLSDRGVRFSRAFVPNPSCCPSRVSFLTGTYSHTNGVWKNSGPYGGFEAFDDVSTLATWLDDAGYRTGLFGKYLNGYREPGFVPPGWDEWFAFIAGDGRTYYGFDASVNGERVDFPESEYSTVTTYERTVDFIRTAPLGSTRVRDVDAGRAAPSVRARGAVRGRPDRTSTLASAELQRARRLRQERVVAAHGPSRRGPAGRDRRGPDRSVPNAAVRRRRRGRDREGAAADGAAVEHLDRVRLRQRVDVGRAPPSAQGGSRTTAPRGSPWWCATTTRSTRPWREPRWAPSCSTSTSPPRSPTSPGSSRRRRSTVAASRPCSTAARGRCGPASSSSTPMAGCRRSAAPGAAASCSFATRAATRSTTGSTPTPGPSRTSLTTERGVRTWSELRRYARRVCRPRPPGFSW